MKRGNLLRRLLLQKKNTWMQQDDVLLEAELCSYAAPYAVTVLSFERSAPPVCITLHQLPSR
jgi:hypothetical protein